MSSDEYRRYGQYGWNAQLKASCLQWNSALANSGTESRHGSHIVVHTIQSVTKMRYNMDQFKQEKHHVGSLGKTVEIKQS